MKWKKLLAGAAIFALAAVFCSSAFAATSVSGNVYDENNNAYGAYGELEWYQGACWFTARTSCDRDDAALATSCTAQFALYGVAVGPVQNALGVESATVGFGGNGYIYGLGGHQVWLADNTWVGNTSA